MLIRIGLLATVLAVATVGGARAQFSGAANAAAGGISGPWTDDSTTVNTNASTVVASTTFRYGLHIWNLGSNLVCLAYTATAAANGSVCAAGDVPIPAGGAYFEDQPGNVSPEAISLIAVGGSSSVTVKVR